MERDFEPGPKRLSRLAQDLTSMLDTAWDAAAISAHERRSWSTVAAELLEIFESLVSKRQAAMLRIPVDVGR